VCCCCWVTAMHSAEAQCREGGAPHAATQKVRLESQLRVPTCSRASACAIMLMCSRMWLAAGLVTTNHLRTAPLHCTQSIFAVSTACLPLCHQQASTCALHTTMQPPSRRARAGGLLLPALALLAVVSCCFASAAAAWSHSGGAQLNALSRRQAAGGPLQHQQLLVASNRRRLLHEDGAATDASPPAAASQPRHDAADAAADSSSSSKHHKNRRGSIDYEDQDPDVRSHWALLVAGSAGWYNYRHQVRGWMGVWVWTCRGAGSWCCC
jgi:hypothetical protein